MAESFALIKSDRNYILNYMQGSFFNNYIYDTLVIYYLA